MQLLNIIAKEFMRLLCKLILIYYNLITILVFLEAGFGEMQADTKIDIGICM
jgi:hypothetical protein